MIHFGLPTFTFDLCFWDESLDGARGRRRALRKHRPGTVFCCSQPKGFRKERRRACGPRPTPEKTRALWFREAWCCPRAPAGAPKYLIPLCFCKSDGGASLLRIFSASNQKGLDDIGSRCSLRRGEPGKSFQGRLLDIGVVDCLKGHVFSIPVNGGIIVGCRRHQFLNLSVRAIGNFELKAVVPPDT